MQYNWAVIMTVCGENDSERLRTVRDFVAAFEREYGDMAVEKLDAEAVTYERITEAVQSLPFLASRKLVVIRGGSLNTDFTEKFEAFLELVSDSTDVLLTEGKLDKRTSFYKLLQKKTEFTEFKELDSGGLARWAVNYATEQGGSISQSDANYLIQRIGDAVHLQKKTGANQILLEHELDKMLLYAPAITRKSIDLMTDENPASKVFDLLDAAFAGDTSRMQRLYADQRAQGVEPQQIIAMLVWQLYIFAVVKAGQGKSTDEIVREAKLSPFVVGKAQSAVRRVSMANLREMIRLLRELDVRSKTEGIIVDEAVRYYLLTLKN